MTDLDFCVKSYFDLLAGKFAGGVILVRVLRQPKGRWQ
jgi:hypothetical protein